ncbi:MAG: 1-acyl-sn-glycerol-3-phosphate acyltransferase [Planctomycetota bacterium]
MDTLIFFSKIAAGLCIYTFLYEILRYLFFKKLKDAQDISRFVSHHQINIDRYKFTHKYLIKDDLLNDSEINQEILKHAKEHDLRLELVREKVAGYIDEIVPFFNILSFYKIGYRIAGASLNFMYDVVIDQEEMKRLRTIKKEAVHIYIMNHRSNVDFVLSAYMLARNICISFAVGEWARVWPLEHLFKSFGSYFVRRGYPEPLYHKVLERYLQVITLNHMTQGIFIEGGLSRDGLFRPPKVGLLSNIVNILKDPNQQKEILIIPTGINFDRVLEDTHLLSESKEKTKEKPKRSLIWKLGSLGRLLAKLLIHLPVQIARIALKKFSRNGYASVSFGEPLSVNEFMKQHPEYFQVSREAQKDLLTQFASQVLDRIKEILPIPPVPIVSYAIISLNQDEIQEGDLVRKVSEIRKQLLSLQAKVVMGKEFQKHQEARQQLEDERAVRTGDLHDYEMGMVLSDEAVETLKRACTILIRRKIIQRKNGVFRVNPEKKYILQYYANSILQFFDPTWVENMKSNRATRISYYGNPAHLDSSDILAEKSPPS